MEPAEHNDNDPHDTYTSEETTTEITRGRAEQKGKQDISSVHKTQNGQKYDYIHVNHQRQNQNQKRQGQRQSQKISTDLTHFNPEFYSFLPCAYVFAA
jgi:hypothetical protein